VATSEVWPITGAPREPRTGSGSAVGVDWFHKAKFGLRLMVGAVSDAGGMPVPVPVAVTVEVAEDMTELAEETAEL
jgi:hypothetical protein